jgi:signal transduction histidine kinase/CheY-like chemotaxis protein
MSGAQAERLSPPASCSRRALDVMHALLSGPNTDPLALEGLMAELAGAFAAQGAGLAALPDGSVVSRHGSPEGPAEPWPWHTDPELPVQLRQSPAARAVPQPSGGCLLVTAFGPAAGTLQPQQPAIAGGRQWTPAEAGALALAGQTLERRLHGGVNAARWALQLDRVARQQRLELAAQVTRRLTHDFGNALTGILGFSELALAQNPAPSSALYSYLSEVHKGAKSGAQLTQVLRWFARRQAVPTRCCPLAGVLAEEEMRLRQAAGPAIRLDVSLPADLPTIALDNDQLRQVLAAVLDNAREAVASAGQGPPLIRVTARVLTLDAADCRELYGDARPGPCVEIVIADNGPGLSPEAQRCLFAEPFFSTKSRRRGFGLASAYGILHAHRGGIDLRSSPAGTEARLVVPVGTAAAAESAAASATGEPAPGERVLVVDDDPMLLQLVARTLGRAGYRAESATRAEDALQAHAQAGSDPFRLVLTDVLMPGLSGVDLAQRLLQRDAGVRVLFMTGQVSLDYLQQSFLGTSFEVLSKPFRPDGLLRAVRKALDRQAPLGPRDAAPAANVSRPLPSGGRVGW